jgi:hypothetical protein
MENVEVNEILEFFLVLEKNMCAHRMQDFISISYFRGLTLWFAENIKNGKFALVTIVMLE